MPNVIKIDGYNFELYRIKVGAFFRRHSVVLWRILYQHIEIVIK